jgi:E3 ubiquitin-protein ligase MARCH6
MHHFRPKRSVKNWATKLWKYFARWFRLTSYFFGGRYDSEEIPSWDWWTGKMVKRNGTFEGSFRRVPATDYIALGRDVRATARVHEDGTPFDEEAVELIEQQNVEAERAQHDPGKDYMIVYLPPFFRYRLFAFMLSMWSVCAVMFGLVVAIPIQLGRSIFSVIISREVHDGYSLLLGFYLLWACYLFGKSIDRLDKRRQRVRLDDGPNADIRLLVFKRGLLWSAKMLYMSLSLGIVVPILLALVVDLYVVLPIRKGLAPGLVPKVRLVDAWALGLVYGKIALHITQLHPPNDVTRGLHHVCPLSAVFFDTLLTVTFV